MGIIDRLLGQILPKKLNDASTAPTDITSAIPVDTPNITIQHNKEYLIHSVMGLMRERKNQVGASDAPSQFTPSNTRPKKPS